MGSDAFDVRCACACHCAIDETNSLTLSQRKVSSNDSRENLFIWNYRNEADVTMHPLMGEQWALSISISTFDALHIVNWNILHQIQLFEIESNITLSHQLNRNFTCQSASCDAIMCNRFRMIFCVARIDILNVSHMEVQQTIKIQTRSLGHGYWLQ